MLGEPGFFELTPGEPQLLPQALHLALRGLRDERVRLSMGEQTRQNPFRFSRLLPHVQAGPLAPVRPNRKDWLYASESSP